VPQWTTLTVTETDPQVGTLSNGQIAFWSGTELTGSSNLFWDNTNSRLGVGTSSPSVALDVTGSVRMASAASTTVVLGNVAADGKLRVDGSIRADGYRSADGSASTPAYRFTNSASTGMFSPASNQLAFATGGTERMRLDASGNVAISSGHVSLQNTDNAARELRLYEPSGSGAEYSAFRAQAQGSNITYTLPASLVSAGFLRTDAAGNLSWQLADDDPGNDVTTTTTFGAVAGSDATVSGTYNALDIQLKSGVVGTSEIADGTITNADISTSASIAVSKLAPGANGQVLVTQGGIVQWASVTMSETDPEVSMTTAGRLARWNGTALVDGSLSDDGNGTLSRSGNIAINPGAGYDVSTDGNLTVAGVVGVGGWLQVAGSSALGSLSAATPTAIVSNDNTAAALVVANDGSGGLISLLGSGTSGYALTLATPTLTADRTWTLPDLNGTVTVYTNTPTSAGQVLTWTASGPQWTTPSSAAETDPQVDDGFSSGQVAFWSGTNARLVGSNNLFWDATNTRLGIGTNSPASSMHVHSGGFRLTSSTMGSTSADGFAVELSGLDVQLRQNEDAEIEFRTNAASGSDTVRMRLTSNGCLRFFGSGGQFRVELPFNGNNDVGRIRATGYSIWSTQRVKTNVRPLDGALDMVLRMRGVRYDWKPEYGGRADIGFIVEEVAPVLPEIVDRNPVTGEYESMDYTRVVAVLVEALKEEHRQNEELRARVAALEAKQPELDQLRDQIAHLQAMVEQLAAQQHEKSFRSPAPAPAEDSWLGQNIPNPHDGTTTIPYYVPREVSSAQLVISDASGRTIQAHELPARDQWSAVTVRLHFLASGRYEYSLVFDGRVVATKQMQLIK